MNNNFQFKFLYQNESNLRFSIESNEIQFGYAIPMKDFLVRSEKLNKIQSRDITKELDSNECKEDPTFESIGTDGVQTAELNASESNYNKIELHDWGNSVESFL